MLKPLLFSTTLLLLAAAVAPSPAEDEPRYVTHIQPIFKQHCYSCHGPEKQKSGLRLDTRAGALAGGETGKAIVPKDSGKSLLYRYVAGLEPDNVMPPKGPRLSQAEVATLKRWIDAGAEWPADTVAKEETWWSLKPLASITIPTLDASGQRWQRSPIDAFIYHALHAKGLRPSPEADRRTLIRRLSYDLLGLPPSIEEVNTFVKDADPQAYEKLVDRYLASPRYGERWARHWLDVVHYGETHGYDKDQPRPHAWPYRDYVIRAFNEDKPYARFIEEQLAGDVLYPGTRDGIEALGFIAAGPWDLIGHIELPETKIDGRIARHLDRDDMVANTINTFQSMTVHCAQCHNHKFDPIPSEDYYRLQAVFAAVDRTNKPYDLDPVVAAKRKGIQQEMGKLQAQLKVLLAEESKHTSPELTKLDKDIAELNRKPGNTSSAYGYHSQLAKSAKTTKWVQVDLGEVVTLDAVEVVGCFDDFNKIGAGFCFPRRFRITASEHEDMRDPIFVIDRSSEDQGNPGTRPLRFPMQTRARYVRFTAVELAHRQNDFALALAELRLFDAIGVNRALKATVTALDSIESPPRWNKTNLVDGKAPTVVDPVRLQQAQLARQQLHAKLVPAALREQLATTRQQLDEVNQRLQQLPGEYRVFAGAIHTGQGNFAGTGNHGGKPRPIHLLQRGNIQKPGKLVAPGSLTLLAHQPSFNLPIEASDGERRVALAKWISSKDNPLTWRSIVNRVWLYHFGAGLVETPNDFGKMGQLPSHPELLDWLAHDLRQHGSLKKLHRQVVTSAVYRQASASTKSEALKLDSNNRLLWKMTRRKLEAEALRDSFLFTAGKLDLTMGGPSYQDYVVEKPEHSPHYRYELKDPGDTRTHRRAIYRSIVRSQQNPWMATMDCADPSMLVEKRNQTISPLQALAALNDPLLLHLSKVLGERLSSEPEPVMLAMRLILQRELNVNERRELEAFAKEHGLAATVRLLWNLNEFHFVD